MINARDELENILPHHSEIKSAYIEAPFPVTKTGDKVEILMEDFSDFEFLMFLISLDEEYDNRITIDNTMKGYIWLKDGSWYERKIKDNHYYWHLNQMSQFPEIPQSIEHKKKQVAYFTTKMTDYVIQKDYLSTKQAIKNKEHINSVMIEFIDTYLLEDYDVYLIHKEEVYNLKLGNENTWTNKEIRKAHNLYKLVKNMIIDVK